MRGMDMVWTLYPCMGVGVKEMAPDGVDEITHDIYEHVKETFCNGWVSLLW